MLSLIQQGVSIAVLELVFYSVKYMHEILQKPDPTEFYLSQELLEVGKRTIEKCKSNRKTPIIYHLINH